MTIFSGIDNFTAYDGTDLSLVKPAHVAALAAHDEEDATANALRAIWRTSCNYCITQIETVTTAIGTYTTYIDQHNYGARPGAEGTYGLALALALGMWDESGSGVTTATATARCVACLNAMATRYAEYPYWNSASYTWQSASWAANFARAAWLLWSEFTTAERRAILAVVVAEANRITNSYTTEYWNGSGDTPGETVAWNATILQVARAMMPQSPYAAAWRTREVQLEIAAQSKPSDVTSSAVVEGQAVKDWIDGYNVAEDGTLINHEIVHPDYMQAILMFLQQAKVTYLFSGASAPASCNFHEEDAWQVLTAKTWSTEDGYESPGGTVYAQDGSYHLYYPEGNDWADNDIRQDIYLLADVYAHKAGWDSTVDATASDWITARAAQIAAMQARHTDGHIYASGEFSSFPPREQFACWQLGDAYLAYRGL